MESKQGDGGDFFKSIFSYFDDYGTEKEITFDNDAKIPEKKYVIEDMEAICNPFFTSFNENELTFNGDVERAKEYSKNEYESSEYLKAHDFIGPNIEEKYYGSEYLPLDFDTETEHHQVDSKIELTSQNDRSNIFSSPKIEINKPIVLQHPRESRINYLLRFPKLYQEFMNSSNLKKLKASLYDALTEECIFHILTSPPMMGVRKIYEI